MVTSFPLESVLGWPFRRRLEQVYCFPRAAAVLVAAGLWLTSAPAPGGRHGLQGLVLVAAAVIATADWALVFRRPDFARRLWPGYALADLALILACIASAAHPAALLPLLFVGAACLPPRLPLGASIATGMLGTALWLWLAPPAAAPVAALVAAAFCMQIIVSQLVKGHGFGAGRDPLTGAYGRIQIVAEMRRLIAENAYPFSLILTDLDGFKQVNDRLGHGAGDRVLQAAARHIAASIRGTDLLARYGGDEFLILLAGADAATARTVAERVRGAVAAGPLERGTGADRTLTVSAGAIEAAPGQDVADLLRAVDEHVYAAKDRRRQGHSQAPAS